MRGELKWFTPRKQRETKTCAVKRDRAVPKGLNSHIRGLKPHDLDASRMTRSESSVEVRNYNDVQILKMRRA